MRRGEIGGGTDPAEGHEQKGLRVVLVISPDALPSHQGARGSSQSPSGREFRAGPPDFAVSLTGARY